MIAKTFDPKIIEPEIAAFWESAEAGKPSQTGAPYCIMIPPPNVTGSLHLGHALQYAIMDTLCRYKRAEGYNVLLQPGTDHAGIATQMVVERQLNAQGIQKDDLSREAFLEKVWEWKQTSGDKISEQMKKMGVSVDWENERFTMDDDFCQAVNHTFISLHEQGYIYRGKRLVNWDTQLQTAVSDLEVSTEERQGQIWYIKYPIENDFIIVATTRPETLLGDMAICVHPDDTRYQALIGKQAKIPLCNRLIPIIADSEIDPEFGTGCVKITPAHDFTDYEIGKRHNLEQLNILNKDGTLNTHCPEAYQGLDRFAARKQIIRDLDELDLLEKIEPHTSALPIGDRSNTVLEPYLTDQWYIKMDDLAKSALEAYHKEQLNFVPKNWGNDFQMWLENIQDWCISRQLWWGHRVPAYYDANGNIFVGESEESIRQKHNITGPLTQDQDVLDTWFSSALWPFATLGWPNNTERLATFYPNSLLVTGFDIIFFWVARMCMIGKHFTKEMPFPTVYVTGLIRDEFGQKMSKSKGNVLDPLDLIEGATLDDLLAKRTHGMMQPKLKENVIKATKKSFPNGIEPHGTDALHFTLLSLSTHTKDINFDLNKLRTSRNFCNKIWNAYRFLAQEAAEGKVADTLITQALDHKIHQLIHTCQQHLNDYRFDRYAQALYEFFWYEFCDWQLELAKVDTPKTSKSARMNYLLNALDAILIILHPAMPFITESLWQAKYGKEATITQQSMPSTSEYSQNIEAHTTYCQLQVLIRGIRNIRSELNIAPKAQLSLYYTDDDALLFQHFSPEISKLANINTIIKSESIPEQCCVFVSEGIAVGIDVTEHINPDEEKKRLEKRIAKLQAEYDKVLKKTSNENYKLKAPAALKEQDNQNLAKIQHSLTELTAFLTIMSKL